MDSCKTWYANSTVHLDRRLDLNRGVVGAIPADYNHSIKLGAVVVCTLLVAGTKGDRYAAVRRTEEYKSSLNTMKSCMQVCLEVLVGILLRRVAGDYCVRAGVGRHGSR